MRFIVLKINVLPKNLQNCCTRVAIVKSIKSDEGAPDFQAMPQDLAFPLE
ncbi:hypothetical protein [Nostoc sp.]